MELFEPYKITFLVAGLAGLMLFIQIIIADVAAIKAHHTPGYPIKPDHANFLFRAARAHENTNESIAIFALFILFGVFSASDALYLNTFSLIYLVSRVAHMCFYYGNFKLARSISFALSLIGLIGMFITGLITYF
mgnify:CR=1 FL=1